MAFSALEHAAACLGMANFPILVDRKNSPEHHTAVTQQLRSSSASASYCRFASPLMMFGAPSVVFST